ncbi:MAG: hypothetical protein ABII22_02595 [Candidatus Micrarchaeota archaeon]
MKKLSIIFILLLFAGLLFAAVDFNQSLTDVRDLIEGMVTQLLPILALTMVVFAAFVYLAGSIGDSSTRARASVWANAFLVSAVVSILLYMVLIAFFEQVFKDLPPEIQLYQNIFLAVVTVLTGIIVIAYGISSVLNNSEWKAYWGHEISQLVASVLILFFALAFFVTVNAFSSSMTTSITGINEATAPLAANAFLERILLKNIAPAIDDLFKLQLCLSHLSTFQRRIGEYVLTMTYKLFPAVDSLLQVVNVIFFGFVAVLGSVSTQMLILNIVDSVMIYVLTAGVILRFIPPTREAGVFLIALAIGFQAIFPLTYILNIHALSIVGFADYTPPIQIMTLCGAKYIAFGVGTELISSALSGVPILGTAWAAISGLVTELPINLLSPLEFTVFLENVAYLSLIALFMPAFSTTITFAFINAFTKFVNMKM